MDYLSIQAVDGTLYLVGELDLASMPMLLASMSGIDGQPRTVDLSGLTFIDSCGLRALLALRRDHRHVRIVNPPAQVQRVMSMTGTTELLIAAGSDGTPSVVDGGN